MVKSSEIGDLEPVYSQSFDPESWKNRQKIYYFTRRKLKCTEFRILNILTSLACFL